MRKYFTLLFLLISLLFKTSVQAQYNTKISGRITNFDKHLDSANSVQFLIQDITINDFITYISELTKDGLFSIHFFADHTQDISLEYKNGLYKILVSPGDELKINFDADDVKNSMRFLGRDARQNNDLKSYEKLVDAQYNGNWREHFQRAERDSSPAGFKKFIYKKYTADVKLLNQFLKQSPRTSIFKNWARQNITYENADDLIRYATWGRDTSLLQLEGYFDFFKNFL